MRKPMFSCAESGTFRFAARRARFSGLCAAAFGREFFAQDGCLCFQGGCLFGQEGVYRFR